ncbi:GMC oxidoreductase [Modestobacter sp. I12A-02662]|uniref:GMC oxidoreductase n=1 Tax=Modestobacter sp. I12A-02662 TaxID=1730496 RepID=UPI0034DED4CA
MFTSLRRLDERPAEADVLVVGSGPGGLALATELRRRGAEVLLLESGGRRSVLHPLNEVLTTGLPFPGGRTGRARGFGGTGQLWAGGCLPLEDSDVVGRPWVPGSAWPVPLDEFRRWQDQATRFFAIPTATFGPDDVTDDVATCLDGSGMEFRVLHHSPRFRVGDHLRRSVADDPGITVVLGGTAVEVLEDGDRVTGVRARDLSGAERVLRARATVLACGALENARLLLGSGAAPGGLGNHAGLLGAGLQDHPYWYLGEVLPPSGRLATFFQVRRVGDHRVRPKLMLSPAVQQDRGLLGALADLQVVHGPHSPVGALKRVTDALGQRRRPPALGHEVAQVLAGPGPLVRELRHRRRGAAAPLDHHSRLLLRVQTEQPPLGDSHLRLSPRRDALGARRLEVHWTVGAAECAAATETARRVAAQAEAGGLARVRLVDWLEDPSAFRRAAADYNHHAGTTRMAADPAEGVVDPDCAVYGSPGLYLVGGSVFPSSGVANPTLTIVALALRLAAFLAGDRHAAASGPGADV